VELGQPEAVGLLDDHHGRVWDVDADLDHGRGDEHVQLLRLEPPHQLAAVDGLQAPVQAADAEAAELAPLEPLGLLLGGACTRRLAFLDQRADDVRLAPVLE
jgi:hypothetical protein